MCSELENLARRAREPPEFAVEWSIRGRNERFVRVRRAFEVQEQIKGELVLIARILKSGMRFLSNFSALPAIGRNGQNIPAVLPSVGTSRERHSLLVKRLLIKKRSLKFINPKVMLDRPATSQP